MFLSYSSLIKKFPPCQRFITSFHGGKNCKTWFDVANYESPSYLPAILRITSATFFTETFGRYHLYIRAARQYLLYQVARRAHIILKHRVTFGSLNFLLRMMQRLGAHIRRMHSIHLQTDFYRIVVTYNYAEAVFKKTSPD